MKVNLVSPVGQFKQAPVGFSWTAFLFGFFVPVFRQDWKWAGIMFGVNLLVGALAYRLDISYIGIALNIVWGIFYNKLYMKELLAKGWTPATDADAELIRTKATL